MNFFFSRSYKYIVNKPIENVLQEFSNVMNRKWTGFSDNITGKFNEDNSFRFTHKWAFGYIRGIFGNNFATINGNINSNGHYTIIETTLKPNLLLVFFFYLFAILFLCELFGINTMLNGPKTYILLFLPLLEVVLFGLIMFMTNGLKNTFEKVFHLQAD